MAANDEMRKAIKRFFNNKKSNKSCYRLSLSGPRLSQLIIFLIKFHYLKIISILLIVNHNISTTDILKQFIKAWSFFFPFFFF